MPRRLFLLLLLLLTGAAACEQAVVDPSSVEERMARLSHSGPANTLPALLQDALLAAERRHGAAAVGELLESWEVRQAAVQAAYKAGDAAAVQAGLQSLRREELRIVMESLGPEIVTRVLSQSNQALAGTRARISAAAQRGADVQAAESSVAQVNELLSRATALSKQDPARALALATDAAGLLAIIGDMTVELQRVRGVDELFPQIAAGLPAAELRQHARLHGEAHNALRSGQRQRASAKLEAVRAEEIRLVLQASENRASATLLAQVGRLGAELRPTVRARQDAGHDVVRLQRMLNTATDLHNRARRAEAIGDHATALDLGSHAAGLLNSLQHLLSH